MRCSHRCSNAFAAAGTVAALIFTVQLLTAGRASADVVRSAASGFTLEYTIQLPVPPDVAYEVMTGDISGWWDHTFSDSPKALFIEAKPGGGFYEIFNDSGDGVLHATVNAAHRGKLLRFTGPLGLAGTAVTLVTTYTYDGDENGSSVKVAVDASGHIEEGWDKVVDGVWKHFLFERLKPYIETGRYLEEDHRDTKY